MKKTLAITALLVCLLAAFVLLTIRVGRTNTGGITGTLVVAPGTSDGDIAQTVSAMRVVGVGWLALSALCVRWVVRAFAAPSRAPISSSQVALNRFMFRCGLAIFGVGVVGGLAFVAVVGSDSPEFKRYFAYFVGLYFVGTVLVWLGKRTA